MPTLTQNEINKLRKIFAFIRDKGRLPTDKDINICLEYNEIVSSAPSSKKSYQMALIYGALVDQLTREQDAKLTATRTMLASTGGSINIAGIAKEIADASKEMQAHYLAAANAAVPEAIKWAVKNKPELLSNNRAGLDIIDFLVKKNDDESREAERLLLTCIVNNIAKNAKLSLRLTDVQSDVVRDILPRLTEVELLKLANIRDAAAQGNLFTLHGSKKEFSKAAFCLYQSYRIQMQDQAKYLPDLDEVKKQFEFLIKNAGDNVNAVTKINYYFALTCFELLKKAPVEKQEEIFKVITKLLLDIINTGNAHIDIKQRAEIKLAVFRCKYAVILSNHPGYLEHVVGAKARVLELLGVGDTTTAQLYPLAHLEIARIYFNSNFSSSSGWLEFNAYFENLSLPFDQKAAAIKERGLWESHGLPQFKEILQSLNLTPKNLILIADAYCSKQFGAEIQPLVKQYKDYIKDVKWYLTEPTALTLYKHVLFQCGDQRAAIPLINFYLRQNNLDIGVDRLWRGYFETKDIKIKLAIFHALELIASIKIDNPRRNDTPETKIAIMRAKVYFCLLHELESDPEIIKKHASARAKFSNQIHNSPFLSFKSAILYSERQVGTIEDTQQQVKLLLLLDTFKFLPSSVLHSSTNEVASLTRQRDAFLQELALRNEDDALDTNAVSSYFINADMPFVHKIEVLSAKKGGLEIACDAFEKAAASDKPNWKVFVLLGDAYNGANYPVWGDRLRKLATPENLKKISPQFKLPSFVSPERYDVFFYKKAAFCGGDQVAIERLYQCYQSDSQLGGLTAYVQRLHRGYFEANSVNLPMTTDQDAVKQAVLNSLYLVATNDSEKVAEATCRAKIYFTFFNYLQKQKDNLVQKFEDEIAIDCRQLKSQVSSALKFVESTLTGAVKTTFKTWLSALKIPEQVPEQSVRNVGEQAEQLRQQQIASLQAEITQLRQELYSPQNANTVQLNF